MAGLQKGTTFLDGNTYNASDLNNLVDNATPQPALITQWSQKTTPIDADKILVSDSANSNALVYSTIANIRTGIGSGKVAYGLTDTGSANAYAVACTPTITSLSSGQIVLFKVANINTGASTLAVDGLTAKNIFNRGAALTGGMLLVNNVYATIYDGTQFNLVSVNDINGLTTTNAPDIANDYIGYYDTSATSNKKMLVSYARSIKNIVCGRLTLVTAQPIPGDITGATTIYFTPYKGNEISLYDGTAWRLYEFTELSLALSGMTTERPQDIFLYDNSGTLTLERVEWSTSTTRSTAIILQDGVYVKSGTTTKRYLGTIASTGATTCDDNTAKRYVWNYYNRVLRDLIAADSTGTYTYTTATLREARAQSGFGVSRFGIVIGAPEEAIYIRNEAYAQNTTGSAFVAIGIGIDSSTTNSATSTGVGALTSASTGSSLMAIYSRNAAQGLHDYRRLETCQASGTTTWYNSNAGSGVTTQIAMIGLILC